MNGSLMRGIIQLPIIVRRAHKENVMSFGASKPAVQPLPPAPKQDDAAIKASRDLEEELLRKRRGYASTILTGAGGDLSSTEGLVEKKSLLSTLG